MCYFSDNTSPVYGSIVSPRSSGSNGHGSPGLRGGGQIEIVVQGTLTVDGRIVMNGEGGGTPTQSGGSGGSILITAAAFNGFGTIQADGGIGGGGGGRISINVTSNGNMFDGIMSCLGGKFNDIIEATSGKFTNHRQNVIGIQISM